MLAEFKASVDRRFDGIAEAVVRQVAELKVDVVGLKESPSPT